MNSPCRWVHTLCHWCKLSLMTANQLVSFIIQLLHSAQKWKSCDLWHWFLLYFHRKLFSNLGTACSNHMLCKTTNMLNQIFSMRYFKMEPFLDKSSYFLWYHFIELFSFVFCLPAATSLVIYTKLFLCQICTIAQAVS
jgi:hypothetical protein